MSKNEAMILSLMPSVFLQFLYMQTNLMSIHKSLNLYRESIENLEYGHTNRSNNDVVREYNIKKGNLLKSFRG